MKIAHSAEISQRRNPARGVYFTVPLFKENGVPLAGTHYFNRHEQAREFALKAAREVRDNVNDEFLYGLSQ